jgi:outer membrane protein assembly factor BamB
VNTHRERWTYSTGGKVRSIPAVDSSTVFFSSDDGFLYAADVANGKLKWKFDLGDGAVQRILPANEPPYSFDYLKSSPVVHDSVLYVGSGNGKLYAVDAKTGALKWTFASGGMIRSTPLVHGAHVYVGSWDGKLYCVDRQSGHETWSYQTKDAVQASPAYADGKIVFGGRDPRLFALDAETGTEVWTHPYTDGSWVESSAVVRGNTLYVGSSDSLKLSAFDIPSGKEIWTFHTNGWSWMTPLVDDGVVYIGAIAATPYPQTIKPGFYAVDAKSGSQKWRYAPEGTEGYITGGVFATPVAVNDMILVADLDGAIRAFRK